MERFADLSEMETLVYDKLLDQIKNKDEDRYQTIICKKLIQLGQMWEFSKEKLSFLNDAWSLDNGSIREVQSNANYNIMCVLDSQQKMINYLFDQIASLTKSEQDDETAQRQKLHDKYRIESFVQIAMRESSGLKEPKDSVCKRIALFTPLRPLKNGIADYMEDILLKLKDFFQFDIFIENNYTPTNEEIASSFAIYNHSEFEKRIEDYDLILYQIGNNPMHYYMVPYILKYHGVIELHEFNLDYLYQFLNDEEKLIADYACLNQVYSSLKKGENPFNQYLLRYCRGIIVHNDYTKAKVMEQDFSLYVHKIMHYSKTNEVCPAKFNIKERYQLQDHIVFASFGFVTYTKRVGSALIAFSRIKEEFEELKMKYLIVGQLNEDRKEEIENILIKYNLTDSVIITGYTELEDFVDYIDLADICVNLRYPYGGESSGALSRIMGRGKACIVSNIGSFAEIPDNCCIKIPYKEENEISAIYISMRKLLVNQRLRADLGNHARQYVKENMDIDILALEYKNFFHRIVAGEKYNLSVVIAKLTDFILNNSFYNAEEVIELAVKSIGKYLTGDNNV